MSARLVKILEDVQSDIGAPSPKIISDEQNEIVCKEYSSEILRDVRLKVKMKELVDRLT